MAIKEEWLDEVLKGCKTPEDITGPNGVIKQLTKRLFLQTDSRWDWNNDESRLHRKADILIPDNHSLEGKTVHF